ncbi:response regulator transcription factor [Dethiosulfatarculus sandiegensis]|uniref:Histidine kinase n=1 Tax=Dethiosulfatarculus sandiegensis TaxID=1429043 RepID=A0A0D2HSY0_9BACT|nr:response regulator [Dethiosulfatarculus sandiegensis]KIX13653.1 histidine kinase [Dethiosulfatarculus sandiegensis]
MGKRILIVDDDPDLVEAVSMLLEAEGMEPIQAYGGVEGLAKARSENPDLIVLDIMMPDKDGYQVAKELAKDDALSELPVIMLTAVTEYVGDTSYSHASGKDLVADDFFEKPVDPSALVARILELVS